MFWHLMTIVLAGGLLLAAGPVRATEPWAPLKVAATATTLDGSTLVTIAWTPGTQVADSYNVYGVSGAVVTFLGVGTDTSAAVTAGYAAYAVSGVLDGAESVLVYATPVPCATLDTDPPPGVTFGWCEVGP